jgi:hypothetical protein
MAVFTVTALRNSYLEENTLLLSLPSIQQGTHHMIEYPDIRTEIRHTARIWHKLHYSHSLSNMQSYVRKNCMVNRDVISYHLSSFHGSFQDYKIHMDMAIVIFA